MFFSAEDGVHGRELWATDGTLADTQVLDARPGPASTDPTGLRAVGDGTVVLFAADGANGTEPWMSDGTLAGTNALADLAPGLASSEPQFGALAGSTVLLRADDGVHGPELWGFPLALTGDVMARNYGAPCARPGGALPHIGAVGLPHLGNGEFAFSLRDAAPASFTALLLGFTTDEIALPPTGCRLLLDIVAVLGTVTSPGGTATIPLAIPSSPTFLGIEVVGQYFPFDPAVGDFGLSDGLRILVGY